jgi:hypothetical protein
MRPMDNAMIATHLEHLDRRLTRVEQILPTLATKDDLRTLATKEGLAQAIAPLATKDELRREIFGEGERSRRYMDVIAESLRSDIQLIAERVASERSKPRKE